MTVDLKCRRLSGTCTPKIKLFTTHGRRSLRKFDDVVWYPVLWISETLFLGAGRSGVCFLIETNYGLNCSIVHVSCHDRACKCLVFEWCRTCNMLLSSSLRCVVLNHWGRVTHICVSKLTIIDLDNGLSLDRRQAIIWTNAGILLIGPLGTKFNETSIFIQENPFETVVWKMAAILPRPQCVNIDKNNTLTIS